MEAVGKKEQGSNWDPLSLPYKEHSEKPDNEVGKSTLVGFFKRKK